MIGKIMHVDDDADTRKAVKKILEKEGYKTVAIGSARACLSKLKKERPDLILLDMMLPGISGWDLFQKIKKIRPKSKVAFLSIIPFPEEKRQEFMKSGVVDYIMKPFSAEELSRRTKKIFRQISKKKAVKKELTMGDFVKRIELKSRVKALAELITSIVVLQTVKNSYLPSQDIIKQALSGLEHATKPGSIYNFLPYDMFRSIENKIDEKNKSELVKELGSRFRILVGSAQLYNMLLQWEKIGLIESKQDGKSKSYKLTKKGVDGKDLLLKYFLNLHKGSV